MRSRIDVLRRAQPSYTLWLSLYEIAMEAAGAPSWDGAAAAIVPAAEGQALVGLQPFVDGGVLALRLQAAAPSAEPALIAELAAIPLLQACRRRFAARAEGWSRGHCPICGAWPALAELRGLERERRLRCGRCGADWGFPPLACPFCGTRDHDRQRALVPEGTAESRRVDACDACRGYVKALAQLTALRPEHVGLEDLASVELDVAAIDRGYERPLPRPEAVRVL